MGDLVDLVTDAPTDESSTAAAATTTLLATADEGAGAITTQVVGFLGFLGGALSMGIVFVVMGYVRGRQSQQTLVRQALPSSSSLANLASNLPSSGSLANLAGMNR